MKTKLYIALGIGAAVAGFAAYYLLSRKSKTPSLPLHENERKHLTNVFAKAKNSMA
jgi:hypothetical protein